LSIRMAASSSCYFAITRRRATRGKRRIAVVFDFPRTLRLRRPSRVSSARFYPIVLAVWFAVAYALGESGRLAVLEPPAPQMILLGLTAILLLNEAMLPGLRRWIASLDLRSVIAVHLSRFVGVYFLVLHERGQLPSDFAVKGGWGDIVVASGALALLAVPGLIARRRLVLSWNVVGFLDILFVVTTAARLAEADPASMRALLRLPLSLLPTFFVPLVIATHVWIFMRLWRERSRPEMD
jgi:hypothetical protein